MNDDNDNPYEAVFPIFLELTINTMTKGTWLPVIINSLDDRPEHGVQHEADDLSGRQMPVQAGHALEQGGRGMSGTLCVSVNVPRQCRSWS